MTPLNVSVSLSQVKENVSRVSAGWERKLKFGINTFKFLIYLTMDDVFRFYSRVCESTKNAL